MSWENILKRADWKSLRELAYKTFVDEGHPNPKEAVEDLMVDDMLFYHYFPTGNFSEQEMLDKIVDEYGLLDFIQKYHSKYLTHQKDEDGQWKDYKKQLWAGMGEPEELESLRSDLLTFSNVLTGKEGWWGKIESDKSNDELIALFKRKHPWIALTDNNTIDWQKTKQNHIESATHGRNGNWKLWNTFMELNWPSGI